MLAQPGDLQLLLQPGGLLKYNSGLDRKSLKLVWTGKA